jgi:glutamine synthetase
MLATILGAALQGIIARVEPPPPISGNAYARNDLPQVPTSWDGAIDAFERSTLLPAILSPDLIRNFVMTKRHERHYTADLSAEEKVELYLDTV